MYIYIHIYIYIYIHTHTHTHTWRPLRARGGYTQPQKGASKRDPSYSISIFIDLSISIYLYKYRYIHTYTYIPGAFSARAVATHSLKNGASNGDPSISIYLSIYIYTYIYIYIHIYTYTWRFLRSRGGYTQLQKWRVEEGSLFVGHRRQLGEVAAENELRTSQREVRRIPADVKGTDGGLAVFRSVSD